MEPDEKKPRPERDQTDESLRTERKKTDSALAEKRIEIEQTADNLVERAREQADEVLDSAREKEDKKKPEGSTVAQARAVEDKVIEGERAAADEILEREREAEARSLARLLPMEREKTDRYLLTERVRSDHALANRDDFMGMVSHDLRNLLSGIVLSASSLSDLASKSEEGDRTVTEVKRIHRYVARMNRLIGDLVDVVSIDAGQLAIRLSRSDAGALLQEAQDAFTKAAAEKDISLQRTQHAEGALMATFDHDRMLQVLANLTTNAIKFTPRGGRVSLAASITSTDLHLAVTDTGPGLPETMFESVFRRFWQAGKNDQRGLGLGLYISKCIVGVHQGRIWVESEVGKGSTFHVTIPIAGPTLTAAAPEPQSKTPPGS